MKRIKRTSPFLHCHISILSMRVIVISLLSIKSSLFLFLCIVSYCFPLPYCQNKFCVKTAGRSGIPCISSIAREGLKYGCGRDSLGPAFHKQRNLITLCEAASDGCRPHLTFLHCLCSLFRSPGSVFAEIYGYHRPKYLKSPLDSGSMA